jgi:hypothetical protein
MKLQGVSVSPFVTGILIMAFVIFAISWGFWKYQYPYKENVPVKFIGITTSSLPTGKRVLPEQRRTFALEFEQKFKDKFPEVSVTTTGDLHTSLLMKSKIINEQFALQMKDSAEAIHDFRDMGFKRLIMYDGKTAWVIKFKN